MPPIKPADFYIDGNIAVIGCGSADAVFEIEQGAGLLTIGNAPPVSISGADITSFAKWLNEQIHAGVDNRDSGEEIN